MTTSPATPTLMIPARPSGASSDYVDLLFKDSYFSEKLKECIEAVAMDIFLRESLRVDRRLDDDPFDAVYLSDLTPDFVPSDHRKQLSRFWSIVDKSDDIEFDDDLEYD